MAVDFDPQPFIPDSPTLESVPLWQDATRDPSLAAPATLVLLLGGKERRTLILDVKPVLIGRDLNADVHLSSGEISKRHAIIERSPTGGFQVRDLGSRNGTRVNGVAVHKRELAIGDRISLGPSILLLFTRFDTLDEKMREAQKMEAIGQLAGGVAHDFNNLLSVVLASVGYLRDLHGSTQLSGSEVQAALADAEAASVRAVELTRQLLGLARRGKYEPSPVDVDVLVQEVARMAHRTIDRSIKIETRTESRITVTADRTQLHQVLMNLCINARDAMAAGGRMVIGAEVVDDPNLLPAELQLRNAQPYVLISVQDSGCGMDEVTRSRAFEPFFSTKALGAGTGLGLATVYGIVHNHGGVVEIDSVLKKGTTVRVYLPATFDKEEVDTLRSSSPQQGRGKLVLLVDDEELVRRGISRMLNQNGFRVALAQDGAEAVEVFRRRRHEIDLVVLDLGMPNMGGEEAFTAIRALDPRAKVLLMSGYAEESKVHRMTAAGAGGFLQKPCTMNTLVETLIRL